MVQFEADWRVILLVRFRNVWFFGHFFGRKIENLRFSMFCFILKPFPANRGEIIYFTPSKSWGMLSQELSEETFVRRWWNLKQLFGGDFLEMCDFFGHLVRSTLSYGGVLAEMAIQKWCMVGRVWEHFKHTYTSLPANPGENFLRNYLKKLLLEDGAIWSRLKVYIF